MASSIGESEKRTTRTKTYFRFIEITIAFLTVFCPLIIVATLLCSFITVPSWTIQNPPEENVNLPVPAFDGSVLYTRIFSNKVTLTSSFASNIAQFAASPFLLLFSFLVALDLAKRHQGIDHDTTKLLQGDRKSLFAWTVFQPWREHGNKAANGTRLAGIGALTALAFTFLLLIGDKLLQGTIGPQTKRIYDVVYVDPEYQGGFDINSTLCPLEKTIPDIFDDSATPPCSIDRSTSPWSITGSSDAYRVLTMGSLNQTGDYNKEDFNTLWNDTAEGSFDGTQLVTHIDPVTQDEHVFYFNPFMAEEDSVHERHRKVVLAGDDVDHSGYDYIANTTSVVTKCLPITTSCGLHTTNSSGSSIPFQCSDIFSGDLDQIPHNGLEQLKGWNTTFYTLDNGSSRNISMASQLNPFSYNITAVVDSINIQGLIDFGDPQVSQGTIFGIGNGRVGFALSCTSTVYNVTYSLVDGNIYVFNATMAAPRTAAIIKAPLQAGFGSYDLFEKATMSVLLTNLTVVDSMELAFSQTLLSLASGVYAQIPNVKQRWRGDVTLTRMGKGSFYFLVVCLFLYAFVVLVFTVIALSIFKRQGVSEVQARLLTGE